MAKKKRRAKRRRPSHMSEPAKRRRRSYHTSRRGKKRRRLSEPGMFTRGTKTFTQAGLIEEAKNFFGGVTGGFASTIPHQLMSPLPVWGRTMIQAGISFMLCGVMGVKRIGIGYAGGATALETQGLSQKMLSEMGLSSSAKYADVNAANQLPNTLQAQDGTILTLMEDTNTNTMYYLNEGTGDYYLAESIYPNYSPRYNQTA